MFHSYAPSSEKPDSTTVAEYVPQLCPLFGEARRQQGPHGATLQEQLRENKEDLLKTSAIIQTTGQTDHLMQNHTMNAEEEEVVFTGKIMDGITLISCFNNRFAMKKKTEIISK